MPQPDAHQLAVAEGVAEREEGGGGAQPGDDVVGAADQDADLAAERLREHQRADADEAERGERAARRRRGGRGTASRLLTCRGRL